MTNGKDQWEAIDGQGTSRVVTLGWTNIVLTDRSTGALQLLVRNVDPDTRLRCKSGGLQTLHMGGHCSSFLRPCQSLYLGKQVGSSHHIVQMEGTGHKKVDTVSLEQGVSAHFSPTHFHLTPSKEGDLHHLHQRWAEVDSIWAQTRTILLSLWVTTVERFGGSLSWQKMTF
jgi:hypothetical protein